MRGGPDIDERLLQAHEDGQVVFFCGAGISYPAKLPGFKGLTERIYSEVGLGESAIERIALKKEAYDTAIGLIEGRVVGGRSTVRRAIANILQPNVTLPNATKTHESLLQLATGADRRRLITTNFDPLFEIAKSRLKVDWPSYKAPLLPIPKNRWDGIVYLHGLLGTDPTETELNNLVVSSGDFGLAYLTERWAARFVGELFRNYTVCFVGYSINDPVLRYMMDALAADRQLGEQPRQHYAFGNYAKGQEADAAAEWAAKNVTPILYRNHRRHAYLHQTLQEWAATYRDGIRGKISIVTKYGLTQPLGSTTNDDYAGRMIWALAAPSGDPARHFSQLDPLPSLEWLEPMKANRFEHGDLHRFGIPVGTEVGETLKFSLISRPTPYRRAPWMTLVDNHALLENGWDNVIAYLANWLVRHIDNPKLLRWTVAQGGPTGVFRVLLQDKMQTTPPAGGLKILWNLVLDGRVHFRRHGHDLYRWKEAFAKDGMTLALRRRFIELLRPLVRLTEPYLSSDLRPADPDRPYSVREVMHADIALASDDVHYFLRDQADGQAWANGLQDLLSDFTGLLQEALELMVETEQANSDHDLSYVYQPSIEPHSQNNDFRDWTALIDLTRDAWLSCLVSDPERAWLETIRWTRSSFPLFRRLVFFAAAKAPHLFQHDWIIDRLLENGNRWIWTAETQHEAMRLIEVIAAGLSDALADRLQIAVLAGPPSDIYLEGLEPEKYESVVGAETFRLLNKIKNSGRPLTGLALQRREELAQEHPEWTDDGDERHDFPTWTSSEGFGTTAASPSSRRDLEAWLLQPPPVSNPFANDDWGDRCRDDHKRAIAALLGTVRRGSWIIGRWHTALSVWWQDKYARVSWRYLRTDIGNSPDAVFSELLGPISFWLREVAKSIKLPDEVFFSLVNRIVDYHAELPMPAADEDFLTQSINHPLGHATDAILAWWYGQKPADGEGLLPEIAPLLNRLTALDHPIFRFARAILARHFTNFFRVDPAWTGEHIQPMFDWVLHPDEAAIAWPAFLHSPRLHEPSFAAFKAEFLNTADHYSQLGTMRAQYANLLTWAALELGDTFGATELAQATAALPIDGLERASITLQQALHSAGGRNTEYWTNRVKPYLAKIWPKTVDKKTPKIAANFAILCTATGGAFPNAVAEMKRWLMPLRQPQSVVLALSASGLCNAFPAEALAFLDSVVSPDMDWLPPNLSTCLEAIRHSEPNLANTPQFQRMMQRVERGH